MASHKTGLLDLPHWSSYSQRPIVQFQDKFKYCSSWSLHRSSAVHVYGSAKKWGFHKCAIQEAEELQCKSLDRNSTKENRPFCPDASKVMRLSHAWHAMEGEFAYIQGIWLIKQFILKKEYLFFINPFCVLGGKKREEMMRRKALGRLWSSLVFKEKLFPLPLSWLCLLHELQPGNIISMWYWGWGFLKTEMIV